MAAEYRRGLAFDCAGYWNVELAPLSAAHSGATYGFPTEKAAYRFAFSLKRLAVELHGVQRDVKVVHPDGSVREVVLGEIADPDTGEVLTLFGPLVREEQLDVEPI